MFKKRLLRKMFRLKRLEGTGGWKKVSDAELRITLTRYYWADIDVDVDVHLLTCHISSNTFGCGTCQL
jgi:hypothetical protein